MKSDYDADFDNELAWLDDDIDDAEVSEGGEFDLPDEEIAEFPLLSVRDVVVYPHLVAPLVVGRDQSLKAVDAAMAARTGLLVVAQRDPQVESPGPDDLYDVGTVVVVDRTLRMPDGTTRLLVEGRYRARILQLIPQEGYLRARVHLVFEPTDKDTATEALMRAVLALFEKVVQLSEHLPEDAYVAAMNVNEPGWLADLITSVLELSLPERQEILEMFDPTQRLQKLSILLGKELNVLELENQIQQQVQQEVDRSQREYFLREQMRVIQNELGEMDDQARQINELREKIRATGMPEEALKKAEKELERLAAMPPGSPETGIITTYLDWLIDLPWVKATEDKLDIAHAAKVLEEHHYGIQRAKERILEHIAVRKLAADKMKTPILCFVGPPGTGKTSMGQSIAEALGRKFARVSLGGVRDEAEIRGHRRTYIGAMPGRIIQTMRNAGTINPVVMLDEIDKLGYDYRGDPAAALLEVLDPEQNHSFVDHYLDVPYDLSKVMFITTANILDTIPPALQDRLEVIEFPGYIEEEKMMIAKRFIIPRQLEQHGLSPTTLRFSDKAIQTLIREYTYEAGVRNLERAIATICRKVARRVAEGKSAPHLVLPSSLNRYLGPAKFTYGLAQEQDEIGIATGIAWTEAGGDILPVEVTLMEGKGNLILTGQLGEVMQESAQAALSYARSHAKELGFDDVDFDKLDIHIHIPEGAIAKDGPSAGITMATALVSALSKRPVHRDVGMTGEITLRGRVLPIGGLKEKVLAAHRAGLKTIVIPRRNQKDLVELPGRVRRGLRFVLVDKMDDVLPVALLQQIDGEGPRKSRGRSKSRLSTRTKRPAAPLPATSTTPTLS